MSRTYRRRGARHEYGWVLSGYLWTVSGHLTRVRIDPRSREGRKAIARFHSDAHSSVHSSAPRWYRRGFDHRLNTMNERELRHWLADPAYDPIFQVRHRHAANWSWW
jgi:hypothetical protein